MPITIGEGAGWQTAELHPAPGETVSFSAAGIPGAQDASELRLHAVVHNAASPGAALHEFTTLLPVKRMLDGLLNRSFYSLDDMALLKLRIALPPAVLASASLVWQVADLTAELSAGSLQSEQILTIPLDRLEARKHPLQVHLYDGDGQQLAQFEDLIDKREPRRNAVALDRLSRAVTVDGNPYFPFAPLVHPNSITSQAEMETIIISHYGRISVIEPVSYYADFL